MFAALRRASLKSPHENYRHAVMVLSGGAVRAIGYNTYHRHAEVMALSKLWPSERRGTHIFSVRFTKDGSLAMAKPCAECQKYLKRHGVKRVTYSDHNGRMQVMRLR